MCWRVTKINTAHFGSEFLAMLFFPAFRFPAPPLCTYLSIPNIQTARPQRGLPRRRSKYCNLIWLPKFHRLSCRTGERARSKFILESFESKLNSDSSDENEMILEQNLDVLVPKYIGMINFACHFSSKCREQTEALLCLVPG